jgi:hypothetical protein
MYFTTPLPGQERPARVIGRVFIAKAFRNYPAPNRARDAAAWVRGEVAVKPTIKTAADVFDVSAAAVRAELERWSKHRAGNGATIANGHTLSDDALDQIVGTIGADRVQQAHDRLAQPPLPLHAAEATL